MNPIPDAEDVARRRAQLPPDKLALLEKRLRGGILEIPTHDQGVPAGNKSRMADTEANLPAASFFDRPLWDSLVAAGQAEARQRACDEALLAEAAREPEIDALSAAYISFAFEKLGVFTRPFESYSISELATRSKVLSEYGKVLRRWLEMLVDEGLLRRDGEKFTNTAVLPTEAQIARVPADEQLYQAEKLAGLLTGQKHPLEFFIPDGSLEAKAKEYVEAPVFRYCNGIAAQLTRSAVAALPAGRPLRIVEVGAGTGGTTTSLLPLLPAAQTTYVYTDITRFFISAAKTKFSMYPFVEYTILDIEKDPGEQGVTRHSFDIVVAAHVLHATRSIRETVDHVRALLLPQGVLLLLEEIRFRRAFNFSMGFLPGFDRFQDYDLRPDHPLLSVEQWRELVHSNGFDTFAALSEPDSPAQVLGVEVMLARAA